MIDHDDPAPYHGVSEMAGEPALSASEVRQVSMEDLERSIWRHCDLGRGLITRAEAIDQMQAWFDAQPEWQDYFKEIDRRDPNMRHRHIDPGFGVTIESRGVPMPGPVVCCNDPGFAGGAVALHGTEFYARRFAEERHGSQRYGEHAYVVHLWAVRQVLTDFGYHGGPLTKAAWLHDVIEDTATTREEIAERFGEEVAALVWAVTGVGKNRKERNASAYKKIRQCTQAAILKLADRIANVEAAQTKRPDMLAMYRKEQAAFEDALAGLGELPMWERLRRALETTAEQARGQRKAPSIKPIYDDVFANGAQWVESLAHAPPDDDEPAGVAIPIFDLDTMSVTGEVKVSADEWWVKAAALPSLDDDEPSAGDEADAVERAKT